MVRTHSDDDHDRKLLDDVERHGWHVVGIKEDERGPAYCFSVGLFHTLQVPEICIYGLRETSVMGQIINTVGDLMKSGERFADWHESDDVLDGFSCMFRRVDRELYAEYFGYARWFYESDDFPMLQCVWPDGANRFPWESDFDAQLVERQPVLANETAWPFLDAKNRAVFTTCRVLDDGYPVLLVTHDEDGTRQFLCNTTNDTDDGRVACLQHIVEMHPSVAELADLPRGWQAIRDAPGEPWQRFESPD